MTHEAQHNGHAVIIEYDNTAMFAEHVRIYRDGVLIEHYQQMRDKSTCNLFRNCGEYGLLSCGEIMNTAADIYAQMCAKYQ